MTYAITQIINGEPVQLESHNEREDQELTQSQLKRLLHYSVETGVFTWVGAYHKSRIGDVAGSTMANGYIYICIKKRQFRAHRLAWLYVFGAWPEKYIDHINGDKSDNRIENLREVSNAENMMNQGIGVRNKSGHLGITWSESRKRWCVGLKVNGKSKNVGRFVNLADAIAARDKAYSEFGFHPNHGTRMTPLMAKFQLHSLEVAA